MKNYTFSVTEAEFKVIHRMIGFFMTSDDFEIADNLGGEAFYSLARKVKEYEILGEIGRSIDELRKDG